MMHPDLMDPRRLYSLCLVVFLGVLSLPGQHAFQQLREFGFLEQAASQPLSGVVEGAGDWLYGTSMGGLGAGVIYRVKKDGSGFSILLDFAGTNGTPSRGSLIVGSDGLLYGTAILPDGIDAGVYRLGPDGSGFQMYRLPIAALIVSGVIEASDGKLYGTTFGGGLYEGGTIFSINKDGSDFAVLHDFGGGPADGYQPAHQPLEGSDGLLYLTTRFGGAENAGVVCRLAKSGASFLALRHFPASGTNDGRVPNSRLVEGPGGYLYGSTEAGGIGGEEDLFAGYGIVYRVSTDGEVYSVVRRFELSFNDGQKPRNIFIGSDGYLYGTSQNAGYALNVDALFRMDTSGNDFGFMFSWVTADNQTIQLNRIIESADGNFYGTSAGGGASNAGQTFKLRPNGTQYVNLHEFSQTGADGNLPWSVIVDNDGTLYGTTLGGGANQAGIIYKLQPNGAYQIIHNFAAQRGNPFGLVSASDGLLYGSSYQAREVFRLAKDGSSYTALTNVGGAPGPIIEASDFLLYGVTEDGGVYNVGSIFRLNPDGTELQEVHSFTNISNNVVAPAGILEGSDGYLYGTTLRGGANDQGMVFKLAKDGSDYEVLHSFVAPIGSLVSPNPLCEAGDGYLYGTTYRGGGNNDGAIYRISKTGEHEFLHIFADGQGNPVGKLVEGPGGWLYGVTQESGDFEDGYVFRFKIGSSVTVYILHQFGAGNLGQDPGSGVVIGPAGEIYGATQFGGSSDYGTVFRLDVKPILAIRLLGTNVELSWRRNGDTYTVRTTQSVGTNWGFQAVSTSNSGDRVTATLPLQSGARFFRLEQAPDLPNGVQ